MYAMHHRERECVCVCVVFVCMRVCVCVCVCVLSSCVSCHYFSLSFLLQMRDSLFELDSIDIPKASYMTDVWSSLILNTCPFVPLYMCCVVLFVSIFYSAHIKCQIGGTSIPVYRHVIGQAKWSHKDIMCVARLGKGGHWDVVGKPLQVAGFMLVL